MRKDLDFKDFILICNSLDAVLINPLLQPELEDFSKTQFGMLGVDVMTRWRKAFIELKAERGITKSRGAIYE